MLHWSPQQDKALCAVADWLHMGDDQQVFRLFGYAGTGKTTLAQHFAEGVSGLVLFGAYTGKAASVMRSKGCYGASTIHSMIYTPRDRSRLHLIQLERALVTANAKLGREPDNLDLIRQVALLSRQIDQERENVSQPAFRLKPPEECDVARADLVVVDECSMVDSRMGEDLLSYGTKVLVLGDPAQLPPVRGGGFFTAQEPDVMLTEIHRQALDNPIIHLATLAREGQALKPGSYGTSRVGGDLGNLPTEVDQILVGKNVTRRMCNTRMRELAGLDKGPVPGDKIVCLRNDHDLGLLNGSLWRVGAAGGDGELVHIDIEPWDGGYPLEVLAWEAPFNGESAPISWWERRDAQEFDYGYALTVHKAQGSQWDSVLLFDESKVFRADRWRWLYTGITRAADRVFVYPY